MVDSVYQDQPQTSTTFLRTFEPDIDPNELVWHRDYYDRRVKVLEGAGWMLQLDNQLPVSLEPHQTFLIPRGVYHRIWCGSTRLKLEIEES